MPAPSELGGGLPEEPGAGATPPAEPDVGGGVSQEPEVSAAGGWPEDPEAWDPDRPATSPEETLRRLEERLRRASEAAERLMAKAAAESASAAAQPGPPPSSESPSSSVETPRPAPRPPPAGWQAREDGAPASPSELEPLLQLVQALRDLVPPDLQRRLAGAIRELLLALRALIDWYLDRFEQRRTKPVDVQDIPIQ